MFACTHILYTVQSDPFSQICSHIYGSTVEVLLLECLNDGHFLGQEKALMAVCRVGHKVVFQPEWSSHYCLIEEVGVTLNSASARYLLQCLRCAPWLSVFTELQQTFDRGNTQALWAPRIISAEAWQFYPVQKSLSHSDALWIRLLELRAVLYSNKSGSCCT